MNETENKGIYAPSSLMREVMAVVDESEITDYPPSGSGGVPDEAMGTRVKVVNAIMRLGLYEESISQYTIDKDKEVLGYLYWKNQMLDQKIEAIEERLAALETAVVEEKAIVSRELSREEAEKEIINLFSKGQVLFYSDVAENLGIDLKLVVEICDNLQQRGEIEVVADLL